MWIERGMYVHIYIVYCRHRIWSSTLTELHPEIMKILWSRGSGAFAENHDRLVPVGPNVFHWRTVSCTSAFRKETNVTKSYTYFINHISSLSLPYQKSIHVGKQQIPFREKSIEIPSQKFTVKIPSRNKPSGLETLCLIEVTTIAWGMLATLQPFLSTCHETKLIEEIGKINSSSILKGGLVSFILGSRSQKKERRQMFTMWENQWHLVLRSTQSTCAIWPKCLFMIPQWMLGFDPSFPLRINAEKMFQS